MATFTIPLVVAAALLFTIGQIFYWTRLHKILIGLSETRGKEDSKYLGYSRIRFIVILSAVLYFFALSSLVVVSISPRLLGTVLGGGQINPTVVPFQEQQLVNWASETGLPGTSILLSISALLFIVGLIFHRLHVLGGSIMQWSMHGHIEEIEKKYLVRWSYKKYVNWYDLPRKGKMYTCSLELPKEGLAIFDPNNAKNGVYMVDLKTLDNNDTGYGIKIRSEAVLPGDRLSLIVPENYDVRRVTGSAVQFFITIGDKKTQPTRFDLINYKDQANTVKIIYKRQPNVGKVLWEITISKLLDSSEVTA